MNPSNAAPTPPETPSVLPGFVLPDGAVTVGAGGDFVDPYFANRALMVAWESGQAPLAATDAWLDWLVPRQRKDGGFDRFCKEPGGWRACKPADADDSSVATFLQLVSIRDRHAGKNVRNSPQRAAATAGARRLLDRLRQGDGIYRAFADQPVAYLMDNAEVYAALAETGRAKEAADLKRAISARFERTDGWEPANQAFAQTEYYPHGLAPTYRWSSGLVPRDVIEREFAAWSRRWGPTWLQRTHDQYAWGLVAWGARDIRDQHWLRCWRYLHADTGMRKAWTVLDEAVDRALARRGVEAVPASCHSVLGPT